MGDKTFIWEYVRSCAAGGPPADCSPVWHFGAISTLLVLAILTFCILVFVRLHEEARLVSH